MTDKLTHEQALDIVAAWNVLASEVQGNCDLWISRKEGVVKFVAVIPPGIFGRGETPDKAVRELLILTGVEATQRRLQSELDQVKADAARVESELAALETKQQPVGEKV